MRLDASTGLAVFSSDQAYQGEPNGAVSVLNPILGNEAGWISSGLWARQTPDDPSDPFTKPWHCEDGTGKLLIGGYPFCRFGGGVAAGSTNGDGVIRWADGTVQPFTGRVVFVTPEGIVAITDGDHTTLDLWERGAMMLHLDCGGPIAQGNQGESDQLDAAMSWPYLTVRVGIDTRLYFVVNGAAHTVADYLQNAASRTTIPLRRTGSDVLWLCEWTTAIVTARPYNSALGLVLNSDEGAQYYIDATVVE